MMNDHEWWNANVDTAAAETALLAAGLPFQRWRNRRPVFADKVDWRTVEDICLACPTPEQPEEAPWAEPEPETKPAPKVRGKKR